MDFYYNPLIELSHALRTSKVDLLSFVSEICDRLDDTEPVIEAFLPELNRRQRLSKEARLLLEQFPNPSDRPPFFGIPVGIKDLFHVGGMQTRGGSRLSPETLSGDQSSIASLLKKQGALIIGKTTTEEFAYHGHPATRNPHNPRHTPGGSSSGSAASVAAGSCPFAIGTQTLQSVIAPASFCGVVGFKPSYGRVPLDGVIFLSPSIDTIGFFTQTVESMEFACSSLISEWAPTISSSRPVLGIPNGVYMTLMFDEVRSAFNEAVNVLKRAGYEIRHVDMPWDDSFVLDDMMVNFVRAEMAEVHKDIFKQCENLYHPATAAAIRTGQAIGSEFVIKLKDGQEKLRRQIQNTMQSEGIDFWISPAQGGTAPEGYDRTGWTGMTAIWSYAGFPTITVPVMQANQMPLGFQCIGNYYDDEKVIGFADALSKAFFD